MIRTGFDTRSISKRKINWNSEFSNFYIGHLIVVAPERVTNENANTDIR